MVNFLVFGIYFDTEPNLLVAEFCSDLDDYGRFENCLQLRYRIFV